MRMFGALLVTIGCGSSTPAERPAQPAPPPPVAVPDAAVDSAVPDEVVNAPAWVFRYNAPGRLETWTMRFSGGTGMLIVEAAQGTTRYIGTVTEAASLTVDVKAGQLKMALECKREKLALGVKCNDKVTRKVDVLNCYHPDFKTPMSFAPEPGAEFVTTDKCSGYRLIEK
jgi:hypothetical protein